MESGFCPLFFPLRQPTHSGQGRVWSDLMKLVDHVQPDMAQTLRRVRMLQLSINVPSISQIQKHPTDFWLESTLTVSRSLQLKLTRCP
jgi:hypothetical protein